VSVRVQDAFADTAYWIALTVKRDSLHQAAVFCSGLIDGQIVTTTAVLLETANALSKPMNRGAVITLLERIDGNENIKVLQHTDTIWKSGFDLYRSRLDKAWSLTDCISFVVMQQYGIPDALTSDEHFRQTGFRAMLLEELA
jgi:predicted nucleic acid-binding protein